MQRSAITDYLISVTQVFWVVLLLQIGLPESTSPYDFRIQIKPLQIQLNHQSPPYIALQAVISDQSLSGFQDQLGEGAPIRLGAGAPAEVQLEPVKIQRQGVGSITVRELRLSRYDFGYSRESEETPWIPEQDRLVYLEQDWVQELTPHQRRRLEIATERGDILNEDWKIPDFSDLVEVKLFEALANQDKPTPKVLVMAREEKDFLTSSTSPSSDDQKSSNTKNEFIKENGISVASVHLSPRVNEHDPVFIHGSILFENGVAMREGSVLEVFREEDGYRSEEARVDLGRGEFEIDIPARYGMLVARVLSQDGQILGLGELNLADQKALFESHGVHKGLEIAVSPHREGLSGSTVTAISPMEASPVATQLEAIGLDALFISDSNGKFHLPMVAANSSIMVHASTHEGHEIMSPMVAGRESSIQLLSKPMIESIDEYLQEIGWDFPESLRPTLLWGHILNEGKPVSGVSVTSEMDPSAQPIYLDKDFKPNAELNETSESGAFIFVGLSEGYHPLLAEKAEKYYSHGNATVTSDALGYIRLINTEKLGSTDLYVYDAFTGSPKPAALTMQSLDYLIDVPASGLKRLRLPKLQRNSFLINRGDENYLPTLHTYIDKTNYVFVPLISTEWWSKVLTEIAEDSEEKDESFNSLNRIKASGNIVGFVQNDDFEVIYRDSDGNEISPVYFDKNGDITASGTAGGGFLFTKIKPGHGTLLVLGRDDPFVHTQLVASEKGIVSVHHFQLNRL